MSVVQKPQVAFIFGVTAEGRDQLVKFACRADGRDMKHGFSAKFRTGRTRRFACALLSSEANGGKLENIVQIDA